MKITLRNCIYMPWNENLPFKMPYAYSAINFSEKSAK